VEIPDRGKTLQRSYEQREDERILCEAMSQLSGGISDRRLPATGRTNGQGNSRNSGPRDRDPKSQIVSSAAEIARAAYTQFGIPG